MNRWFRAYFRAAEDQGGAPAEGVDDRTGGGWDWGEQADQEYAKRFPGGPSDMWKSINEGTQKITQLSASEQRAAELEAELEGFRQAEEERSQQWEDPLSQLPNGVDDATMARLVAMFQHDPAGAYDLARSATPGYGSVLENQMLGAWMAKDPAGAMRHLIGAEISPVLDERFQSFEEILDQRLGPALSHTTQEISRSMVLLSRTMAPDIGEYEGRIEAAIIANPALLGDVVDDAQKGAERLVQLRDMIWAADQRAAAGKPPVEGPKPGPAARTARQATIGRSDEPPPSRVDDDYAKKMTISPQRRRGRGAA